ncbi:MAG: glycosyltransferase family 87 protein [Planctomycetia bacterium]|nr:glycosyltransferase family 87 protein [Planctomycetia bacterium]
MPMFNVFMLYEVNPTTWFYLSWLMITGIFFKFRRVWSVRNLDLFLLLSLGPGLLLIGNNFYWGYVVTLSVLFLLVIRMLCDPMMNRRPLLEVNLSKSGLIFCCVALMLFNIAGLVLTQTRDYSESQVNASLEQLMMFHLNSQLLDAEESQNATTGNGESGSLASGAGVGNAENVAKVKNPSLVHAPGLPFFTRLSDFPRTWRYEKIQNIQNIQNAGVNPTRPQNATTRMAREQLNTPAVQLGHFPVFPIRQIRWTIFLATLAQIAIVTGIVMTGWAHFENFNTGIAAATLYLLLPYVCQIPSRLDHLIPGALIVWAVFSWRLPALSGVLLGIAAALCYYPLFLFPLWCAFYWSRGLWRFLLTSVGTFLFLICISIPIAGGWSEFLAQSGDIFGCIGLFSRSAAGFWEIEGQSVFYRLPVIAIYMMLVLFLTFWPSRKNIGTLMSSSAALMAGAQFCHPFQGGTYMAWFLPLMILVIFRPNLEDRTAYRTIGRRRRRLVSMSASENL